MSEALAANTSRRCQMTTSGAPTASLAEQACTAAKPRPRATQDWPRSKRGRQSAQATTRSRGAHSAMISRTTTSFEPRLRRRSRLSSGRGDGGTRAAACMTAFIARPGRFDTAPQGPFPPPASSLFHWPSLHFGGRQRRRYLPVRPPTGRSARDGAVIRRSRRAQLATASRTHRVGVLKRPWSIPAPRLGRRCRIDRG